MKTRPFKIRPSISLDLEGLDTRSPLLIPFIFFSEDILNVFKHDPDFEANEAKYMSVKQQLLGDEDSDESGSEKEGSGI